MKLDIVRLGALDLGFQLRVIVVIGGILLIVNVLAYLGMFKSTRRD